MDILEGLALVEHGSMGQSYYLTGDLEFWAKRWLDKARQWFLGEAYAEGYVVLEGVTQWTEVDLALRTNGFFSTRRMVVVRDGTWAKRDAQLEAYRRSADPDVLLVIWDKKPSVQTAKIFGPQATIELKPLAPAVFRRFVAQEAKKRHLRVTSDAMDLLAEMLTRDAQQVIYELDKMALYDPSRTWDEGAITAFVPPLPHDTQLWRLTDPLVQRQTGLIIKQAQELLKEGKAPLLLFIVAVRQLIQLNHVLSAKQKGQGVGEFARQEGLKEFPAKKLWQYSQYWTRQEIEKFLERAAFIDRALKSGYGDAESWLLSYLALLAR
ncbi:MAG: DNA polymerase III subunit delta [Sulfobacillus thermosulfidooxidans]|nr:MAG: DNA polymerase III subunit delta [Sulfobacillus thermosulfidooxidans]